MPMFEKNEVIESDDGKQIEIIDMISADSCTETYCVDLSGKDYDLIWVTDSEGSGLSEDKVASDIGRGPAMDVQLWPLALIKCDKDGFGYIINCPKIDRITLADMMRGYITQKKEGKPVKTDVIFPSYTALSTCALNVIDIYRLASEKGLLTDARLDDFIINNISGDVRLTGYPRTACPPEDSRNTDFRYMAPETVADGQIDAATANRYQLALTLFMLMMHGHPLEGARVHRTIIETEESKRRMYGPEALFIFDPTDGSNVPINGIDYGTIKNWNAFPDYLKETFTKAFTEGLHAPSERPAESDWIRTMSAMRCDAVECQCGKFIGLLSATEHEKCFTCPSCGREHVIIPVNGTETALTLNKQLFYRDTVDSDSTDFRTATAKVVENRNKPGLIGLKNLSESEWKVVYPGEVTRIVTPNGGTTVSNGMTVDFSYVQESPEGSE